MRLEYGKALLNAALREETLEGRRYLVAPAVLLVEGVHQGNFGPVYYPPEELSHHVDAWNGIPVLINHPRINGTPVPANTPEIIEREVLGRVFHTRFDPNGNRLLGEVWIDIEKAERLRPGLVAMVRSTVPMELSTCLYFDDDDTAGTWRGEEYAATVGNYKPEHLALLPDATGACSVMDGCGLGRNKEDEMGLNILSTARTPSFQGTESTSWGNVTTSFSAYRDAYYRSHNRPDEVPSRVQDAPSALKSWVASKTLLGDGGADNERDLIFFPVVNPRSGKLNEGALRAVISGRGAQANIPATAKTSAQNRARALLREHFGAELEDQAENEEETRLLQRLARAIANWLPQGKIDRDDNGNEADTVVDNDERSKEGAAEKEKEMEKEKAVAALIACDQTRFTEDHKEWLMSLNDSQLESLQPPEPPKDEVKKELERPAEQKAVAENKEEETQTREPVTAEAFLAQAPAELRDVFQEGLDQRKSVREQLIKGLVDNKNCEFTRDELEAATTPQLRKFARLARVQVNFEARLGGQGEVKEKTVPDPPLVFNLGEAAKAETKVA